MAKDEGSVNISVNESGSEDAAEKIAEVGAGLEYAGAAAEYAESPLNAIQSKIAALAGAANPSKKAVEQLVNEMTKLTASFSSDDIEKYKAQLVEIANTIKKLKDEAEKVGKATEKAKKRNITIAEDTEKFSVYRPGTGNKELDKHLNRIANTYEKYVNRLSDLNRTGGSPEEKKKARELAEKYKKKFNTFTSFEESHAGFPLLRKDMEEQYDRDLKKEIKEASKKQKPLITGRVHKVTVEELTKQRNEIEEKVAEGLLSLEVGANKIDVIEKKIEKLENGTWDGIEKYDPDKHPVLKPKDYSIKKPEETKEQESFIKEVKEQLKPVPHDDPAIIDAAVKSIDSKGQLQNLKPEIISFINNLNKKQENLIEQSKKKNTDKTPKKETTVSESKKEELATKVASELIPLIQKFIGQGLSKEDAAKKAAEEVEKKLTETDKNVKEIKESVKKTEKTKKEPVKKETTKTEDKEKGKTKLTEEDKKEIATKAASEALKFVKGDRVTNGKIEGTYAGKARKGKSIIVEDDGKTIAYVKTSDLKKMEEVTTKVAKAAIKEKFDEKAKNSKKPESKNEKKEESTKSQKKGSKGTVSDAIYKVHLVGIEDALIPKFDALLKVTKTTEGEGVFNPNRFVSENYKISPEDPSELKGLKTAFKDAYERVALLNKELFRLRSEARDTHKEESLVVKELTVANRTLEHARIAIKNFYDEAGIDREKRNPLMESLKRFEDNSISRRNLTGYASRFAHNMIKDTMFGHIGGKRIDDGNGNKIWSGGVNVGGSAVTIMAATLNKIYKWAVQYGKESIRAFGEIESIKTNLSVVYGNESLANNTFGEISQYAVKSPFGVQQMTEFAILLKQSGVESVELMKTLKQIGDVAGGNQEKFQRIANNYAQIIAANRATSLDLRQFANAGLPIYKEIRKELGVSQKEVREMTREGLVGADVIKRVFENMTSEGGSFYNSVQKGSKTYKARMQNMADIKQLNLAEVGELIYSTGPNGRSIFQDILKTTEDIYSILGKWAKNLNQNRVINAGDNYNPSYQYLLDKLISTNDEKERKEILKKLTSIEESFNYDKYNEAKADKYDNAINELKNAQERYDQIEDIYKKINSKGTSKEDKRILKSKLVDQYGIDTETQALMEYKARNIRKMPDVIDQILGSYYSAYSLYLKRQNDYKTPLKSAVKKANEVKEDLSLKDASNARKSAVLFQDAYSQLKLNDNLNSSMMSLRDKFDELYKSTDAYKAEQEKLTRQTIEQLKEAKNIETRFGITGPDYDKTRSGDFNWVGKYYSSLKNNGSLTAQDRSKNLLNQVRNQYSAGDSLEINESNLAKDPKELQRTFNVLTKNASLVSAVFANLGKDKDANAYDVFMKYNSVLTSASKDGSFNKKDLKNLREAMAIAKDSIEGLESSEYKDLLMKLFAELTHVTLTDADISAIEKQNSLLPFYKRVLGDTLGIPEDVLRAAVKTNQMGSGQRLVDFYKKSNYRNENLAMSKALLNSGMSAKDVAGIYASATGGAVTDTIEKTRKINQEDANKALKDFAMSLGSASTVTQALADQYSTELEQLDNLFAAAAFKMEDAGMVLNEENASKLGYTKKDMEALVEDINAFNSQVVKNEDGTVTFNEKTLEAADALREFIKSEKIAAQELSSMKKIIEDNNKAIRDSREKSAIYGSAAGYTGSNSWERLSRENQNNLIQKVNNEALAKDVNGNYVNEALKKAVNDGTITAAIQYVAKNDIAPEGFEDVKVGGQAFATWAKKLLESQNKVQDAERRSSLSEFTSQALDSTGGKAMYDYNQAGIVYRERNSELVKYDNLIQEANNSIKDVEDINEKIYKEGLKYYQDSIKESQKRQKALEAERTKIQNKKGISDDERSLLLDVNYDDSIEEQGNERLIRQSMLEYQTAYAKETESLYGKRLETDYHINELTKAREVVEKEKLEAAEKMNLQEIEHTPNLKKALFSSLDPFNFFSTTDYNGNVVSSWGNNSGRQQTAMNALGYSGRDITRFSKEVLSNPDAQQNVKTNLLNAASYAGFSDKSITNIASQIDEAFKSNDFEGLDKLIKKLGLAKDATDNINTAALGMSASLNSAFKSSLLNFANDSFQQIGKNLRDGKESTDGLYKMWKNTSSAILGSIGATMTQTGLTIAAEAAKGKKWTAVLGGLSLAAAGGVANIASGFLSDSKDDKSKDDEAQKIQNLKDALSDLIDQAKTDAEYYQKNLMHKNALAANAQISTRSVSDAIITPNGSVVTTHPDDYLIATKTPDKLLGAAQNGANGTQVVLQVNPVVINQSSANITTKTETKENADGSLDIITVIIDAVNSGLASGQLDEGMAAYQYNQQGRSVAM